MYEYNICWFSQFGIPGEKNLCVMFVFAIVSFLFFSEYQFAVDIVQLEFTRAMLSQSCSRYSMSRTYGPRDMIS
jgi:hypothetical protein